MRRSARIRQRVERSRSRSRSPVVERKVKESKEERSRSPVSRRRDIIDVSEEPDIVAYAPRRRRSRRRRRQRSVEEREEEQGEESDMCAITNFSNIILRTGDAEIVEERYIPGWSVDVDAVKAYSRPVVYGEIIVDRNNGDLYYNISPPLLPLYGNSKLRAEARFISHLGDSHLVKITDALRDFEITDVPENKECEDPSMIDKDPHRITVPEVLWTVEDVENVLLMEDRHSVEDNEISAQIRNDPRVYDEWIDTAIPMLKKRRILPGELMVDNNGMYWLGRENQRGIDTRDIFDWKRIAPDAEARVAPIGQMDGIGRLVRSYWERAVQEEKESPNESQFLKKEATHEYILRRLSEEEREIAVYDPNSPNEPDDESDNESDDESVFEEITDEKWEQDIAIDDYKHVMYWFTQEHKRPALKPDELVYSQLESVDKDCINLKMDIVMQTDFEEGNIGDLVQFQVERMVPVPGKNNLFRRDVDKYCFQRESLLEMCLLAQPMYVHPTEKIRYDCDRLPEEVIFKIYLFYIRDVYNVVRTQIHCQKFLLRTTGAEQYLSTKSSGMSVVHGQLHPIYDIFPQGTPLPEMSSPPVFRFPPFMPTVPRAPPGAAEAMEVEEENEDNNDEESSVEY